MDLFATPPYLSLSHAEEMALHNADHGAWVRYAAQGAWPKIMKHCAGKAHLIAFSWRVMSEEYRVAVWATLDHGQQQIIRAACCAHQREEATA